MASRIQVAINWNTMLIQYFNQNEIWNTFWKELSRLKFRVNVFDISIWNSSIDEYQYQSILIYWFIYWIHLRWEILEARTKGFFILRRYINRENWTILCPRGWCKLEQLCLLRAKDMRYITGKTWYKHVRRISYHVRNILIWYTK